MWKRFIWGKTASGEPDFHHLACHLLDVGSVAAVLLEARGAEHWLQRLASALGCEPEGLKRILPLLIGLHDLGKACPSFQAKSEAHAERIRAAGAPWPLRIKPGHLHDLELARSLARLLPELRIFDCGYYDPRWFWHAVSLGVTAHHGSFLTSQELQKEQPEVLAAPEKPEDWSGRNAWGEARAWLVDEVRARLCPAAEPVRCDPQNLSAAAMLLNGFTILCDWIGSDQGFFPPRGLPDISAYAIEARRHAERGIRERGLLSFLPTRDARFRDLFPKIAEPRPVQRAVDQAETLPIQCLALIEAPMGEGKTEAAWLLACRLASRPGAGLHSGCYFALPTVATSNQMYERVKHFLRDAAGDEHRTVLAPVNGLAEFHPDVERVLEPQHSYQSYEEDPSVYYETWFLPRKRSLLAPYGVGTVDQALLAGLNTRHVGLRLFGLAGKVVIIDEVHAYDLYMSKILDRLVEWLKELGASVVLLSATLPARRREELLRHFTPHGRLPVSGLDTPYPLISVAERDGAVQVLPCEGALTRDPVRIERRLDGRKHRAATARWLLNEMRTGARAAWICNTVAEAQQVYRELRKQTQPDGPEVLLFHARFLQKDRRDIERRVLERFGLQEGRETDRARPVVLVATQVVEQSLDLDFDVMVSQFAPVDLLLQRLGRLHRHPTRVRPECFRQPRLVLLIPEIGTEGPNWGRYRKVYAPLFLLHTWKALAVRTQIELPGSIRGLVEAVYSEWERVPEEAETAKAGLSRDWFAAALKEHLTECGREKQEALRRLLREPDPDGQFWGSPNPITEEDEAEAELPAQTRLGEPSIRVVLLDEDDELARRAQKGRTLPRDEARRALEHGVSLSRAELVDWTGLPPFEGRPEVSPPAFRRAAALRSVALLPLRGGRYAWTYQGRERWLRVDPELGIVFDRDDEEEG